MAKLKHELWEDTGENGYADLTFCLSGSHGRPGEGLLSPDAKLIWTVEAESQFEAMTKYYAFMNWGEYKCQHEADKIPYPEEES